MKYLSSPWCTIGVSLLIAAAGISELIDQNTMIILIVVLIVCTPSAQRRCFAPKA